MQRGELDFNFVFSGDHVRNNPLNATDPSGYSLSSLWKKIRPFVGAIVAIALSYTPLGPIAIGMISGAAGAAANGGNIGQGALFGMVSAAAFFAVGSAFSGAQFAGDFANGLRQGAYFGKVLAHAMVGGTMSVLQGGKFGHGFAAAGFTQAVSGSIDGIGGDSKSAAWASAGNRAARIAVASIVGGTASSLSGGKFANGAITGAFSRAFNDERVHDAAKSAETNKLVIGAEIKTRILRLYGDSDGNLEFSADIKAFSLSVNKDGEVIASGSTGILNATADLSGALQELGLKIPGVELKLNGFSKNGMDWSISGAPKSFYGYQFKGTHQGHINFDPVGAARNNLLKDYFNKALDPCTAYPNSGC